MWRGNTITWHTAIYHSSLTSLTHSLNDVVSKMQCFVVKSIYQPTLTDWRLIADDITFLYSLFCTLTLDSLTVAYHCYECFLGNGNEEDDQFMKIFKDDHNLTDSDLSEPCHL